ncbi:MAG: exo-alpha-sialidase [Marmoricola sp.]|nr:exo-alpha-sialidase [Marmoricola sp.]
MAPVRRIATTTLLALVTGLGLTTYAGASASASSKPPPVDPGRHQAHRAKLAGPDQRRNPGLKAVLSEKDTDRGAEGPALSALCQAGVGKPNPYRNPSPNVDQIVGDTTVAVGSQTGCKSAQNENTIAVNPENPRNLVAGTNDYRVFNSREQRNDSSGWAYTSFDGGRSWKDVQLPHLTFQTGGTGAFAQMDSAGDPVVGFGPHNTVYYGNIVFSRGDPTGKGTEAANGISLNVSHDGGLHWSEPVLIQADGVTRSGTLTPTRIFNDKIWLAADKHSGRVYVTWTRFADNADGSYLESPIVLAASGDYGRTFGPRQRVDVTLGQFQPGGLPPYSSGSNPQVARDGALYIAYEGEQCATLACDQVGTTDRDVTVVARSRDHGRTFTKTIVDTNYDFPFNEPLGTPTLTGENFRVNSFPQLAYDEDRNQLAVTWNDDRNGRYDPKTGASLRSNGDNILALSSDGRRWTRPMVLGTPQDEVFGAVAIHDGTVAVSSYTRHYAGSRSVDLDYAFWSSASRHGPHHFDLTRVTTQSSDPQIQFPGTDDQGNEVQGLFIGDYTGVVLGSDGVLHPNWTDFRGNPGRTTPNQDAYTQAFRIE